MEDKRTIKALSLAKWAMVGIAVSVLAIVVVLYSASTYVNIDWLIVVSFISALVALVLSLASIWERPSTRGILSLILSGLMLLFYLLAIYALKDMCVIC
ncbi:hypothetical protein [Olivibacter sitiensis]|uniref:hypothetical protein n=1 Tax=Olivibacter sitiensis TaxID=376470 RepID=UPI0003FDA6A5|nr:hypothetical protein [Olivibacter sitiensis]